MALPLNVSRRILKQMFQKKIQNAKAALDSIFFLNSISTIGNFGWNKNFNNPIKNTNRKKYW